MLVLMRLIFISWLNQLISLILVYGPLMCVHGGKHETNPIKEGEICSMQHPLLLG